MKILITILNLSFIHILWAQDCASLKDGEVLRLDTPGGSLENFKVQDQDGVGTCYANAASLLLQSGLPNHPEISYLQMASLYKKDPLNEKRQKASQKDDWNFYANYVPNADKAINGDGDSLKWDLAIDSGNTCLLIKAIKSQQDQSKTPLLCLRNSMNLEKMWGNNDAEHNQFKTILESSKYMNLFQANFNDMDKKSSILSGDKKKIQEAKDKYETYKNIVSKLIEEKKKYINEITCATPNKYILEPISSEMNKLLLSHSYCLDGESAKTKLFCKALWGNLKNPRRVSDSEINSDGLTDEFMNLFKNKLSEYKGTLTPEIIKKIYLASTIDAGHYESKNGFDEREVAQRFISEMFNNVSNRNIEKATEELNDIFTKGISQTCVERNLINYLTMDDFKKDWQKDPRACDYGQLLEQAQKVILNYKGSGLENIEAVLDFILNNARLNFDEAFLSLYAFDCSTETKIKIPDNISCEAMPITNTNKDTINHHIYNQIKSNKAVTGDFCSAILKKPKNSFKEKECGLHGVGIIGLRCEKGKYQYLIQNSWGTDSKAKNPALETIEGRGAYWFDEQSFYDAFTNITSLTSN